MFTPDNYFVQLFAWALLNFIWQGVFIIVSLYLCDFIFRKSSSSFRYGVFRVHLVGLCAAPVVTVLASHRAVVSGATVGPSGGAGSLASTVSWMSSASLSLLSLLVKALPYILLFWVAGIFIGACFLLGERLRDCRMQRLYPQRGRLRGVIHDLAQKLNIKPPMIFEAEIASPFVAGVRKQRLVLPERIEEQLGLEELRGVLAHELAHVKRADYRSNLLHAVFVLLLWPHPAAWILWAQLRHEREVCCDEAAVQLCGSAAPLARGLYHLAVNVQQPFRMSVSASAGSLEVRLQRMLNANRPSTPKLLRAAPAAAMIALTLATAFAARTITSDMATRRALIISPFGPTISIRAHDPAGVFYVQLHRGRVSGVSIGNERIPTKQVVQQGESVRVIDRYGKDLLDLQVNPAGGISWYPRAPQGHSSFD